MTTAAVKAAQEQHKSHLEALNDADTVLDTIIAEDATAPPRGRQPDRAAPWAASHVLVSRALGPVAGRAVAQERKALLQQVDAADARYRALQAELRAAHGLLPESQTREAMARDLAESFRKERDAAYVAAELARRETEQVRMVAPPEMARADRAEAALAEVRQHASREVEAMREQLEVTAADWRCAEAEARKAETTLAVTQAELRGAEDRAALAEARLKDEVAKWETRYNDALRLKDLAEAQRSTLTHEKASLEGEIRALEARFQTDQEPVREERATLHRAVEAAEARARAAVAQVAVIEQDRTSLRQALASGRLELESQSDSACVREDRLRADLATVTTLAKELSARCESAEQARDACAARLEETAAGSADEAATRHRADLLLQAERRRAEDAEEAQRHAEQARYLALHRPSSGGVAGFEDVGSAITVAGPEAATPRAELPTAMGTNAGPGISSSATGAGTDPPWWWGVDTPATIS